MELSLKDIRELARAPRQIELPDVSQFQPRESLVQLWRSTAGERVNRDAESPQCGRRYARSVWRELLAGRFVQPGRHNAVKKAAAYFFATQRDPAIARIVTHAWNATHCIPPTPAEEVDEICDWFLARGLKGGRR
jgi:hypothetical protein